MATSDSYGQSRVFVRNQSGAGPTTAGELAVSGGTVTHRGQFTAVAGSSMAVSGNLVLGAGSTFSAAGQVTFPAGSSVAASGNLTMAAGSTFSAAGQVSFPAGSSIAASGNLVLGQGSTFASSGQLTLAANSTLAGLGKMDLSGANITFPGTLARSYFDLGPHLWGARQLDASGELVASGSTAPAAFFGGLLMPDGAPSLNGFSTANKISLLSWASANVVPIALPPIMMPADLATAGGLTLELYGETVGTASAADAIQAIAIAARFITLTSATAADVGSTHPNFSSTPAWQGITIASGSMNGSGLLSVRLTPQAHANRALNLYGMRGSYAKKTS